MWFQLGERDAFVWDGAIKGIDILRNNSLYRKQTGGSAAAVKISESCVYGHYLFGVGEFLLFCLYQIGKCDRLALMALTSFRNIHPSRVVSNDINVNTQTGIHQLVTQQVYERVVHELTAH